MRPVLLAAAGLVAVLAAVALAVRLLAPPPSDESRIRRLFADAASAVAQKRVGDAMDAVAEDFHGNGLDHRGLHRLILGHTLRGAWVQVHVAADRVSVDGDQAEAILLAVLARSGAGTALAAVLPENATALRIACRLRRDGSRWIVAAAEWHPIGVEEARGAAVEWFEPEAR